jgi:hypothetical protein
MWWVITYTGRQKKVSLPVKTQGDSYSCDIVKSEYDTQISLSPTNFKRERIKLYNRVCTKNVLYACLITIYSIK